MSIVGVIVGVILFQLIKIRIKMAKMEKEEKLALNDESEKTQAE